MSRSASEFEVRCDRWASWSAAEGLRCVRVNTQNNGRNPKHPREGWRQTGVCDWSLKRRGRTRDVMSVCVWCVCVCGVGPQRSQAVSVNITKLGKHIHLFDCHGDKYISDLCPLVSLRGEKCSALGRRLCAFGIGWVGGGCWGVGWGGVKLRGTCDCWMGGGGEGSDLHPCTEEIFPWRFYHPWRYLAWVLMGQVRSK